MLQVSTWVRSIVVAVILAGFLIALPNALPQSVRDRFPAWLPNQTVSLGLDLQGGSYLLLEVELDAVTKDKLESLTGDIRRALRKAHPPISYRFGNAGADSVAVQILDPARYNDAKTLIQALNPTTGGGLLAIGARAYDFTDNGQGLFTLKMTDTYKAQTRQEILDQSIEVVRKRIDSLGTREPAIERQGDDRIVVQKRVVVAGDRLVHADAQVDQSHGEWVVSFRFDSVGAKEFGDITKAYPGGTQRFAVVLDKQVITAPVIQEPILGGSGQITGSFTAQSAQDLATMLNAGALPAPLKVIDRRTVGAELGADQIKAGRLSAIAGLVLVALFMIARYGLFGLFADIALTLNVVLLMAALTLFNATLTLPGIAGIVLTMGMAVDANVLIYERIKEEQRNGRSMLASIDQGFRRAMATIIDANSTHLIAALILFELGSGPVRGFAVTLGVGIATSFFTAVMVTRLIVITWLNLRRPKRLAI